MPTHIGVAGNEVADGLPKIVLESFTVDVEVLLGRGEVKVLIREKLVDEVGQ